LYKVIGVEYGDGDGSNTAFNLPNILPPTPDRSYIIFVNALTLRGDSMFSQQSARNLRLLLFMIAVALFGSLQPALAQSGVVWTGQYYNNPFFIGDPTLVQQDNAISFNWGGGAPNSALSADNFSVRWATDIYFEAGTYHFSVVADDSVYLWVDYPSQPQLDTFNNPSVSQTVGVDLTLTAGFHHIQLDYQELSGDAYVYLSWVNVDTNPVFPIPPSSSNNFWTGQYYANTILAGEPIFTLTESTPTHNWGTGSPATSLPADNFSARWTSLQTLPAGQYDITVRADDGVRVYVDGILYIDEWHISAGAMTYTATLNLAQGQHQFYVYYYEGDGNAFLDFNFGPTPIVISPPTSNITLGSIGTIRVQSPARLNVRSEPSTDGFIINRVRANASFPILGRNADSSWWQINVNGTAGWVYWRYLGVTNAELVSVIAGSTGESLDQPPTLGFVATPFVAVNIRSGSGTEHAIIGLVPQRTPVSVVGRNASGTWWQINYGQITGWVSAQFVPIQIGTIVGNIPITG